MSKHKNLMRLVELGYNVPKFQLLKNNCISETNKLNPKLLYSVRSSPERSMPGILKTITNVNVNNICNAAKQVRQSWYSANAKLYRKKNNLSNNANKLNIVIQEMFDATGPLSGSGIVITKNSEQLHGEFIKNESGESLVSGKKTPMYIGKLKKYNIKIYNKLKQIVNKLTLDFELPQEVEFAFSESELVILQTRDFNYNVIKLRDNYNVNYDNFVSCGGIGLGSGDFLGTCCFNMDEILNAKNPIFFANYTTPDQYKEFLYSGAVVTAVGGQYSHAAVLCRKLNIPAIIGSNIKIKNNQITCVVDGHKKVTINSGDIIVLRIINGNPSIIFKVNI